ncbi:MAG: DEAD/DEAH box helicase [Bacteroidales bacterium]|nr:DEAD/DEAH box helicase [Candidatus Liminaster caballi]
MNLTDLKQFAVGAMGFDRLNVMQEKMLDAAASGQNVVLLSPTGSGKTVAFLLALLASSEVQAESEKTLSMVIVPSRELAQQIGEVARKLGMRTVLCYGGHDPRIECQRLESLMGNRGLIVGTSGRLKDHMERGRIATQCVRCLVLDEYDKMLELGFEEELKYIVTGLRQVSQTLLTSATHAMPIAPWINMRPYAQLDFTRPIESLKMYQVKSPVPDKLETMLDLLTAVMTADAEGQAIVFSNYRESAERISHFLSDHGVPNALYHGGMEQDIRDKALIRLRTQSVRVLVSTDLASRGLDIPEVAHIVHYHLPADAETFTHRNGRTARNGSDGCGYMIVGPAEVLPEFAGSQLPYYNMSRKNAETRMRSCDVSSVFAGSFSLVYVGRGKKEKISKSDVVGFFTKIGGLTSADIGRIEVMEHCSYVAIDRKKVADVLLRVRNQKIKGEKTIYKEVEGN